MIKLCLLVTLVVFLVEAQRAPQDEPPRPYNFQYDTKLGGNGQVGGSLSQSESGDAAGRKVGRYEFEVEDGRKRVVEYEADENGFRAVVKSNEPGFSEDNPADVVHNRFRRRK
ncbi:cuticle protein 10.9-like [Centruroides sculpturatus]|nr:cuticle protein 10.9-like [Centruroides sculpturatus]